LLELLANRALRGHSKPHRSSAKLVSKGDRSLLRVLILFSESS
jgi:hypothetical protein